MCVARMYLALRGRGRDSPSVLRPAVEIGPPTLPGFNETRTIHASKRHVYQLSNDRLGFTCPESFESQPSAMLLKANHVQDLHVGSWENQFARIPPQAGRSER